MQRDLLLLGEMIEAAERAHQLTDGLTLEALQADRLRSESLLWNFTVLGEAASQLSAEVKDRFPDIPWQQPARLRSRIAEYARLTVLGCRHRQPHPCQPVRACSLRRPRSGPGGRCDRWAGAGACSRPREWCMG